MTESKLIELRREETALSECYRSARGLVEITHYKNLLEAFRYVKRVAERRYLRERA